MGRGRRDYRGEGNRWGGRSGCRDERQPESVTETDLPLHANAEAQGAGAGAVEDAADAADYADVAGLADVDGRVAPVRMVENVDRGKLRVQVQLLRQGQLLVHAEIP